MKDLLEVEVITHVLGSLDHCSHCQVFLNGAGVGQQIHKADLSSYPSDWKEEWQQFSDLIFRLSEKYAGKLVIRITDAQSLNALWKALRYGVRKYPTFIIGPHKCQGIDEAQVSSLIDKQLHMVE
jgi:hypothetical protein